MIRKLATIAAITAALATGVAGCGSSAPGGSGSSNINLTGYVKHTVGIQGSIVKLSGAVVTVHGQLVANAKGTAAGPVVTREVKLWSVPGEQDGAAQGMRIGDQVYLINTPPLKIDGKLYPGGFAQDKARDAREGTS